jgi:hypothetical protein
MLNTCAVCDFGVATIKALPRHLRAQVVAKETQLSHDNEVEGIKHTWRIIVNSLVYDHALFLVADLPMPDVMATPPANLLKAILPKQPFQFAPFEGK